MPHYDFTKDFPIYLPKPCPFCFMPDSDKHLVFMRIVSLILDSSESGHGRTRTSSLLCVGQLL